MLTEEKKSVAIVLAAGQGKRMNSSLPKVAHKLLDKSLIIWVIESLMLANIKDIILVISPSQNIIKDIILNRSFPREMNIYYAYQDEPLGTAHAVKCGLDVLYKNKLANTQELSIIVAYGDTPAVKAETFKKLLSTHINQKNSFTVLSFVTSTPYGYGRIITNTKGEFIAIREQKDCSKKEEEIQMCNSGFLCANFEELYTILPLIKNNNSANEYYLTDIPIYAKDYGFKIGLMIENDESQFLGINTIEQLKDMEIKLSNKDIS